MVHRDCNAETLCTWLTLHQAAKMSEIKEKLSVPPKSNNGMDFVTVVSVGSDASKKVNEQQESTKNGTDQKPGYVTVLKIGDEDDSSADITEEVLVYRLPGERLGFGLKFEGGTKAAEFVNRLFIQSCAPDSPASMVQCSWGKLTEGDEVLKIDSQPVTSMTRIDCVRCLKDSNVVIKLLVRHCINKKCDDTVDGVNSSARLVEDLPHVIGAEKKRTPPPPPPVPPRKVPRKILKDPNLAPVINVNTVTETDSAPLNIEQLPNGTKYNCFQSPRNSGKFLRKSPEVSRHMYKDRRLSDVSIGPPDAEVYLDLFSQEPGCNLSESDDTGSSISTIIDRLSSFPTTCNSSFAGSLPSTPTSIQKHLDVSICFENTEIDSIDNYWYSQLALSQNYIEGNDGVARNSEYYKKTGDNTHEDGNALQPPMNFQDAPLSYGNEDVGVPKSCVKIALKESLIQYNQTERVLEIEDENGNCIKDLNNSRSAKDEVASMRITDNNVQNLLHPLILNSSSKTYNGLDDLETDYSYLTELDLPRLVYFMPKLNSNVDNKDSSECKVACTTIESVKFFLENEIRTSAEDMDDGFLENAKSDMYNPELYNLSWSLSSQLDTIGEDDEESIQETASLQSSTPIVIIDKADVELNEEILERIEAPDGAGTTSSNDGDKHKTDLHITIESLPDLISTNNICETMDMPPSSSRQPPDGDEFPDYHETTSTPNDSKESTPSRVTSTWSHKLWSTNSSYNLFRDQQSSCSVRDKIAIFSSATTKQSPLNTLKKSNRSTDDIPSAVDIDKDLAKFKYPFNKVKRSLSTSCKSDKSYTRMDNQDTSHDLRTCSRTDTRVRSSLDLSLEASHSRCMSAEKMYDVVCTPTPRLHSRSQSLMDISTTEKIPKKDRWSLLAEHRQRSLSKLKGLVIPERVVEVDTPNTVLDLPEIKSNTISTTLNEGNCISVSTDLPIFSCQRNSNVPSLSSPPWSGKLTNSLPKYSPAFKRKSLQLHSESFTKLETHNKNKSSSECNSAQIIDYKKSTTKQLPTSNLYDLNSKNQSHLNDAPKSLESITSPTRSDYSFEYVSISPEIKLCKQQNSKYYRQESNNEKCEIRKSDDDSDNDSAVSSSQSSYVSRSTPPASPSHLYSNYSSNCVINGNESLSQLKSEDGELHSDGDNQNHRLLKPQSVEAINRQNILASAKCRSGRDLKIGSPLIQRRFEEDQKNAALQNGIIHTESKQINAVTTREHSTSENNVKPIEPEPINEPEKIKPQIPLINREQTKSEFAPEKPCLTENVMKTTNVSVKSIISPKTDVKVTEDVKIRKAQDVKLSNSTQSPSVNNLRKSFEKLIPPTSTAELNKVTNLHSSAIERNNKTESRRVRPDTTKSQDFLSDNSNALNKSSSLEETIVLRPAFPGGSVGITLAGGADYETKEITVHKIRDDSSAYRDGRLRKGDIVLAINGTSVKGLTHKELVTLLKEPEPEVTLVVCKTKNCDITATSSPPTASSKYSDLLPKKEMVSNSPTEEQKTFLVPLMKDLSGLGLSLKGGQDSLLGSKPLLIKKIFKGGAAEKTGKLQVGDEILLVNETDVSSMSRFEAWSILKKLPENITISLTVRRLDMP